MKSANNIIASVDLIDGSVVRLQQGDYGRQTRYRVDALEQLSRYIEDGSRRLHIVDLDGARDPEKRQTAFIAHLVKELSVPVQTGGGVRTEADVRGLLDAGVARVVLGSVAVSEPQTVSRWFQSFGADRLVLALDCRIDEKAVPRVVTQAWQKASSFTVAEMIEGYLSVGLKHVLCTDVAKDGLLKGSNVKLYQWLCRCYPGLCVQASGGIGSLDDIRALSATAVDGIIIGRALLEEKFTVKEAIECWLNASSPV